MVRAAMRRNGLARRAAAEPHSAEVAAGDLRWLLITALVLAATLALFFAALFVYRATGPHAIGWAVIRRLRRASRWLLPRWSHRWRET